MHLRRYQANMNAHPMSGFLDDIWSDVSNAAKKEAATIVNQAPKQIASSVATSIAKNPQVQQAAQQTASQAAIDATAKKLADAQKQLAASFAAFKTNPVLWVKNNPGKTAMFIGAGFASAAGIYFLLKGMGK